MKRRALFALLFTVLAFSILVCPAQAGTHPCGSHLTNCVYDCCCLMEIADCDGMSTEGECCDATYRCYNVIDYCQDTTTTTSAKPATTTTTAATTTTTSGTSTTVPLCSACVDGTSCGVKNSLGRECVCSKACDGSPEECPFVCKLGPVPATTTTTAIASTTTTLTPSTTIPTCGACVDGTSCGAKNSLGLDCVCSKACDGNPEDCPFVCVLGSVPTTTTSTAATTTTISACSACPDGTSCGEKNSAGRNCVCGRICVNPWSCTFVCVLDRLPGTTVETVKVTTTTKKESNDERTTCCGFHEPSNVAKEVSSYYCGNGVRDGGESDVDCGGPCGPCADGRACVNNGDCRVADCTDGLCRPVHCSDGIKNLGESAVDCGGPCGLCADTLSCGNDNDCRSGDCGGGVCRQTHCSNGKTDWDETDIDCGGSCSRCPGIGKCLAGSDCVSGNCTGGRCGVLVVSYNESPREIPYMASTCKNGLADGGEVDVDCGGVCGQCRDESKCLKDSDCDSNYCVDGACKAATCGNGKQDAGEGGVDCGGSCAPCEKTDEQRGMSMVYGLLTFLITILLVFLLVWTGRKAEKDAVDDYKEMEKAINHRRRIQKS